MDITVTTLKGFESILAHELDALGAEDIQMGARAVTCFGDKELLYRANYELRTALRVLVPFYNFRASSTDALYKKIRDYNFLPFLKPDQSFSIDVACSSEYFTHSQFVTHKVKDGIVDRMRSKFDQRPSISIENPDFKLHVRIVGDEVTLSTDSSGESLHKRGYRVQTVSAPMSEVLAAGLVIMSGWDKETMFLDPMAGSGTIAIEAAMIASNTPAQYCREKFLFQKWSNFDRRLWEKVVDDANERIDLNLPIIFASDKDRSAIDAIKANLVRLPFRDKVIASQFDFFSVKQENATIIFNPPYDERMKVSDVLKFYEDIGTHLKHKCSGSNAWIFSSNFEAMKNIGLKTSRRHTLYNGPLECKYFGYELFQGKRAHRHSEEEE